MKIQESLAQLNSAIEVMKDCAISGDMEPHQAYALIRESGIEDVLKKAVSEIKDTSIEELRNNYLDHNTKTYKGMGYSFTVRNGTTRYYFTDVEEIKVKKLLSESTQEYRDMKETEQKYKTAYLMKIKNQIMVDDATGEIIDPSNVKVVYGPDTLSVKRVETKVQG